MKNSENDDITRCVQMNVTADTLNYAILNEWPTNSPPLLLHRPSCPAAYPFISRPKIFPKGKRI